MVENLLGCAAEEGLPYGGLTIGSDNDKIDLVQSRESYNLQERPPHPYVGLAADRQSYLSLHDGHEMLSGQFHEGALLDRARGIMMVGVLDSFYNVHHAKPGSETLRKWDG